MAGRSNPCVVVRSRHTNFRLDMYFIILFESFIILFFDHFEYFFFSFVFLFFFSSFFPLLVYLLIIKTIIARWSQPWRWLRSKELFETSAKFKKKKEEKKIEELKFFRRTRTCIRKCCYIFTRFTFEFCKSSEEMRNKLSLKRSNI